MASRARETAPLGGEGGDVQALRAELEALYAHSDAMSDELCELRTRSEKLEERQKAAATLEARLAEAEAKAVSANRERIEVESRLAVAATKLHRAEAELGRLRSDDLQLRQTSMAKQAALERMRAERDEQARQVASLRARRSGETQPLALLGAGTPVPAAKPGAWDEDQVTAVRKAAADRLVAAEKAAADKVAVAEKTAADKVAIAEKAAADKVAAAESAARAAAMAEAAAEGARQSALVSELRGRIALLEQERSPGTTATDIGDLADAIARPRRGRIAALVGGAAVLAGLAGYLAGSPGGTAARPAASAPEPAAPRKIEAAATKPADEPASASTAQPVTASAALAPPTAPAGPVATGQTTAASPQPQPQQPAPADGRPGPPRTIRRVKAKPRALIDSL